MNWLQEEAECVMKHGRSPEHGKQDKNRPVAEQGI